MSLTCSRRRVGLEHVVLEAVGDQAQRRDRGSQVVRDRGHQPAPSPFLGVDARDHRLDVGRERCQFVLAAHGKFDVAGAGTDFGERTADGVEVRERPARYEPRRAEPDQSGVARRERHEQGVVGRDEHERGKQRHRRRELRRDECRERSQAPTHAPGIDWRSEFASTAVAIAERSQDLKALDERVTAVYRPGDRRDRHAAGQARPASDRTPRRGAPHGTNRYPTPHTVSMNRGCSASGSSLARRRRMCTVTVEVSI